MGQVSGCLRARVGLLARRGGGHALLACPAATQRALAVRLPGRIAARARGGGSACTRTWRQRVQGALANRVTGQARARRALADVRDGCGQLSGIGGQLRQAGDAPRTLRLATRLRALHDLHIQALIAAAEAERRGRLVDGLGRAANALRRIAVRVGARLHAGGNGVGEALRGVRVGPTHKIRLGHGVRFARLARGLAVIRLDRHLQMIAIQQLGCGGLMLQPFLERVSIDPIRLHVELSYAIHLPRRAA